MIGLLLPLLVAMSWRRVDFTSDAFGRFVREVFQRLDRLEGGFTNRGRASFDETIKIGPVELICQRGNGNIFGLLDGAILAGDNTLKLQNGATNMFPDAPFTVIIGSEEILVLGMNVTTDRFSPLGRGYNGTTPAAHADLAPVRLFGPDVVVVIAKNTLTGRERLITVLP